MRICTTVSLRDKEQDPGDLATEVFHRRKSKYVLWWIFERWKRSRENEYDKIDCL